MKLEYRGIDCAVVSVVGTHENIWQKAKKGYRWNRITIEGSQAMQASTIPHLKMS